MSGNFVAEYKNATTYFVHQHHLGSARVLTALDQSVAQNLDYLPFGELNSSDSGITTHEFTGDERDSETGLDHTWFRQYSSSLGRWMHPDPAGLVAVDITNPQSWNRYAYVLDNPMNLVDLLGLEGCGDDWITDPSLQGPCPGGGGDIGGGGGAFGFPPGFGGPWPWPWNFCDRYLDPFCGPAGWCDPGIDMNCGLSPGTFSLDLFGAPISVGAPISDPCKNATLSAAGVSPKQQIATAQGFIALGKAAASGTTDGNSVANFFGGMFGYYEAVHTGGLNDIKNLPGHSPQNRIDVNAGNISFGITCPYSAGFCQFAAGLAQTLSGRPDFSGTLLTGFDTPSDNTMIRVGQAMRAAGCHE